MAVEGEEIEYESDPEDSLLPSAMRRREASDDEDGDGSDGGGKPARAGPRVRVGSDGESDGQGGAPVYEDDEEFEAEEELEEEVEEEVVEVEVEERVSNEGDGAGACAVEGEEVVAGSGGEQLGHPGKDQVEEEEEKKENEPFAVPTAGAFYMHDDRFRPNGGGRNRRMSGGRKLWESKDDQAWVHDRFEEMTLQDARYDDERRTAKGRFRGRGSGRTRGTDRGYVRGNRSRAYDDGNNQNRAPKVVRGRGPRRYEPPTKNNSEITHTTNQNKQYAKPRENIPNTRKPSQASNLQPDPVLPQKQVFASSLSSASPPFYPSGSPNQDISVTQKRDAPGTGNKTLSSSMQMESNISTSQTSSLLKGKAIVGSIGQDRLYMDDSIRPIAEKTLVNTQFSVSSSSPINTTQAPQSRIQSRGLTITGPLNYQSTPSLNQVGRFSAQSQPPAVQQRPVQLQTPVPALRISTQQLGHRPGTGSHVSSPPRALSTNSSEAGEAESPPGSSKSKAQLVGKGKASNQGPGRGSFLYSGAQVIGATGAMGLAHGDQNFPALLPVMQFRGQHPGGLGVPAVGMALPGYVAQPQSGFGNSEMTWLPVLAGAAGALGASYCSPYLAFDGGYYARPSGQASSSVSSSRETSTAKPANTLKPPQRPEIVNDEFGQRQNKPRRYSEMNFGQ